MRRREWGGRGLDGRGKGRIPVRDMRMTGAPSSGATSLSVPTLGLTPASMGHEPVMVLPCPSHPTPSFSTSSSRSSSFLQNISICLNFPPPLHSAPVFSNIPVARRSNEPQLRFTFLSNLGPSSHH